jgi:3-polyprenyl-4-hydroxybenzoate decarboxylase
MRVVEGPFGEGPSYLGPQRFIRCVEYEVRAISYRKIAMYQPVITPEDDPGRPPPRH